jgi:hypothetical protein
VRDVVIAACVLIYDVNILVNFSEIAYIVSVISHVIGELAIVEIRSILIVHWLAAWGHRKSGAMLDANVIAIRNVMVATIDQLKKVAGLLTGVRVIWVHGSIITVII